MRFPVESCPFHAHKWRSCRKVQFSRGALQETAGFPGGFRAQESRTLAFLHKISQQCPWPKDKVRDHRQSRDSGHDIQQKNSESARVTMGPWIRSEQKNRLRNVCCSIVVGWDGDANRQKRFWEDKFKSVICRMDRTM